MLTVKQVSELTGVSIRTLHHYDAIGLLRPTAVTDAGYRLYDGASLARLRQILFFRELAFPLADIKRILASPDYDAREALRDQLRLLELRRNKLDKLIGCTRQMLEEGDMTMDLSAFKNEEYDEYAREAKAKWGATPAWQEFEARDKADLNNSAGALMELLGSFAPLKAFGPASPEAAEKVGELQAFITAHFYTCTEGILRGLGEMYVGDERFRRNIDAAAGEGTAEFIRDAIRAKTEIER